MARYFITTSASFDFGLNTDVQVDSNLTAIISIDGTPVSALTLGTVPGIQENENPATVFNYDITNYELPSTGTVTVDWYAYVGGSQVIVFPTTTNPSVDVEATGTYVTLTADPLEGAVDVSTRDSIVLTASHNFDTTTLETFRIQLRIVGTTITTPISVYVNPSAQNELIIKPLEQLNDSTTYELFVGREAFYSTVGYRLEEDFTLSFTTGADDFDTVTEATSQGVVERVGPLIIAGGGTGGVTTTYATTFESSAPADGAYNFNGDELVFVYSDNLDDTVLPTVEISFESLFGLNQYYYVDESFWGEEDEPTFPTVTGTAIVNNELTITLSDIPPGNAIMTVTVTGLETDVTNTPVEPKTIVILTKLFPFRAGVAEVRRLILGFLASDITNADIAALITNLGLDLWEIYGDDALPQQRCVIKHAAALNLIDDYMGAAGLINESKVLGAFSVSRSPSIASFASGPYARIKNDMEKCKEALDAFFARPQIAVKSITNGEERPNYRIRTWRLPKDLPGSSPDENTAPDRSDNLPGPFDSWS